MSDLSSLMPDPEGINFYSADPDLAFLLRRYLSEADDDSTDLRHFDTLVKLQLPGLP